MSGRPTSFDMSFTLDGAPVRARVYATAHGLYELFLNGSRVGDLELTPGTTAYRSQLDVQTYDVTELLVPGNNVLGAVLSDGWWRGQVGFTREVDCFGTDLALLVQLEAELEDGAQVTHGTGPGWTTATGEIVRADLIAGEAVDLHRGHDGWDRDGFDDGGWDAAPVVDGSFEVLTTSPAPPVRRVEELRPASIERLPSGNHVIDFGQNINGWVRLDDLGPDGTVSRSSMASCWTGRARWPPNTFSRTTSPPVSRFPPARWTSSSPGAGGRTASSLATRPTASVTSASRATRDRSTPAT